MSSCQPFTTPSGAFSRLLPDDAAMMVKQRSRRGKRNVPKSVLQLPDLDQVKSAVLNSLSSDGLTTEPSEKLWNTPDSQLLKGKRDRALLAVLIAPGLRRHEAVNLDFRHVQQREDHWAIVDLKGKAGHTRAIPMPGWVKALIDEWVQAANLTAGKPFRRVNNR